MGWRVELSLANVSQIRAGNGYCEPMWEVGSRRLEGNQVFRDRDETVLGPYHHGNGVKKREIEVDLRLVVGK